MVTFVVFLQTAESAPKQIFPDLKELIATYEKPGQGLVVHLLNPIKRTSFCPRWRRSRQQNSNIYGKSLYMGLRKIPDPISTNRLLCKIDANRQLVLHYLQKASSL
jgi:hypothetical protein